MSARYAALGLLLVVASCAWIDTMMSRSVPDTRIRLQPGQVMEFNRVSGKNSAGQHIDEYRCANNEFMYCDSHGVVFECECFRK